MTAIVGSKIYLGSRPFRCVPVEARTTLFANRLPRDSDGLSPKANFEMTLMFSDRTGPSQNTSHTQRGMQHHDSR